jgi:hypothetical protein
VTAFLPLLKRTIADRLYPMPLISGARAGANAGCAGVYAQLLHPTAHVRCYWRFLSLMALRKSFVASAVGLLVTCYLPRLRSDS